MSLDPQAAALLKSMEESDAPPFHECTPEEARIMYDKSELVHEEPPEPHSLESIKIPGQAGPIDAWVYKPSEDKGCQSWSSFTAEGLFGSLKAMILFVGPSARRRAA